MRAVGNGFHLLEDAKVLEGWMTVDHLIENTAQRPDIALPPHFEPAHAFGKLDGLWRHVVHCADLQATS